MSNESSLIRDDGPNRLRLYRRDDSPNFYYEVFIDRKRVARGSTGSTDNEAASRMALDAYEDVLSKHRRGVPLRSPTIKTLMGRHLEDRDREVTRGEITEATVDQARIVLEKYFLDWCETQGVQNLIDLSDQRMRDYVEWRRSFRPSNDTISYMRNGKVVHAKRPANHLRGLNNVSLLKQLDPIRRFLQWCVELGYIEDRDRPRIPRIRARTDQQRSQTQEDVPGRWFPPEQATALLRRASEEARAALDQAAYAHRTYGPRYRARFVTKSGDVRPSQRAVRAELFFYWLVLMMVSGTRPVELRTLKWRSVGTHHFRTGRLGVSFNVVGKRKRRQIVLDRHFLEIFYRIAEITHYQKPLNEISADGFPEDPDLTENIARTGGAILFHDLTRNPDERDSLVFPIRDFSGSFYGLMKRSGIYEPGHSPYSLRHTHINYRLLQGDDHYRIAIRVGNSVKMIENYYNALTPVLFAEREHNERSGTNIKQNSREFEEIIVKEAIREVQLPIRSYSTLCIETDKGNDGTSTPE